MFKRKERKARAHRKRLAPQQTWARVGKRLTFRAELMPSKEAVERTFIVERVLSNGRVELTGLCGQHAMTEFEPTS